MNKKVCISFIIAVAMILSVVLVSCSNVSTETSKEVVTTIVQTETTETEKIDEPDEIPFIFTLDEDGWREYGIPSSFDLRSVDTDGDGVGDRCFVTKVKFQNPYGTCWGFASLAASEISILGSIYLDDPDAYKTLDLSEKQFTYFMNVPLNDENNPQNGEGYIPSEYTNDNIYDTGGFSYHAITLFAQGVGLSEENKEGNEVFIYKGKNGYTEQRLIDGEFRNFSYSKDDDWSIPEEYRFKFDYVLNSAFILLQPNDFKSDEEYEFNEEAAEQIKLQLLQRRGVEIAIFADDASPDEDDDAPGVYLNTDTWAHYSWETQHPNHDVTIIGWDDNYPKENFLGDHMPPENGAWLVKNSWGSGEEEFPNKGDGEWGITVPKTDENGNVVLDENGDPIMINTGYFWVSYYDRSLSDPTAYIFEEKTTENDYHIDQHNYLPLSSLEYSTYETEVKMSNVFKAEKHQFVDAISVITPCDKLDVHYDVYLLRAGFDDPEDGLLVASSDNYFEHSGYYNLKLENQIEVQPTQYYSVVVTIVDEDGLYYIDDNTYYVKNDNKRLNVVINKNESFILVDGKWNDLYNYIDVIREDNESYANYELVMDNYPIKAFSHQLEDRLYMKVVDMADEEWKLCLKEDSDKTIVKLRFVGESDREMLSPNITWNVYSDTEDVISIEELKNGGQLRVKGLNEGQAYLTVHVDGIGTSVVRFDVYKYVIKDILVYDAVFEGEAVIPDVCVFDSENSRLEEGKDYEIIVSNNDKIGVGKVEIKPIGIEFAEGVSSTKYFLILPPGPELETVSIVNGKLTGKITDQSEYGVDGYNIAYRIKGSDDWEDWIVEDLKTTSFKFDVEKNADYEVSVCSYVIITGMEMDDEMAEYTYDEEYGENCAYSDWSADLLVSGTTG